MGAAYQTVAKQVQNELDRIRKEASAISNAAREALDHEITTAVAESLTNNTAAKKAIETALKQVITDFDAS